LGAASLIVALAVGQPARAAVWLLDFQGPGVSGNVAITAVPNVSPTDPNPNCGTPGNNACRTDPAGAYMITSITGTFSDSNTPTPIVNANITGLVPINPTNERDATFDPLVPASLSYIDYANETIQGSGALSYNNLFFPDGSPIDCAYPFSGTLLDVFGAAFTIVGGDTVDFWGDGNYGYGPLTYGVGVTDGTNELDYQFSGISAAVREPGSVWLLASGLLGVLAWRQKFVTSRTTVTRRG
jgi:hypothetical protein